jgi:biopolymer transport protein ExbD
VVEASPNTPATLPPATPARAKARIEIIPFIDVVFFLPATFVLFTRSLNRIKAIPLNLPFTSEGREKREMVTIQVTDGGAAYWNRELIEPGEIPVRLAHYKTQTGTLRVAIAGDARAKSGAMVTVLDEVRRAGITHYSVETKARRGGD